MEATNEHFIQLATELAKLSNRVSRLEGSFKVIMALLGTLLASNVAIIILVAQGLSK